MTDSPDNERRPSALRIGDWVVSPSLNRLNGRGEEIQIEPRLMQVLLCLAATPGDVVTRDELLDRVWGDIVVGEEALTRTVSELRRILRDDTQSPIYIETIRKGGYRLLPVVEPVEQLEAAATTDGIAPPAMPDRLARTRWALWLWPTVAIMAVVALWIGMKWRPENPVESPSSVPLRSTPLTSYPGVEILPALSPDGTVVAFTWNGPNEDNFDIYIKQIGEEAPLRLTDEPDPDTFPVWAPGGKSISYIHTAGDQHEIWTVPLLGGEPREILRAREQIWGFAWLDDTTMILGEEETSEQGSLFIYDLATGDRRRAVEKPAGAWDYMPKPSPDGHTVAFLRREASWHTNIYLLNLDDGTTRQLTSDLDADKGLCWDSTGESLIYGSRLSGNYTLWRTNVADGTSRWVPIHGERMFYPTVSQDPDRMVFQYSRFERNVWRVSLGDDSTIGLSTTPLINSSSWDSEASYSPDGNHVTFTSARSGNQEVWACQADGEHPVQLTRFDGPQVTAPDWSPEGSRIALSACPEGFNNLYVADYADRSVRRVTRGKHHDLFPTWSPDGSWIYCSSNRDGQWRIWRIPADGDTTVAAIPITDRDARDVRIGAGGQHLFYTRMSEAGLWRMPLAEGQADGAAELYLPELPGQGSKAAWDLWPGGIAILDRSEGETFLLRHEFATGHTVRLTNVPQGATGCSVSPDGRHLLYQRVENRVVDLVLVEGFR
jgi:Tol biopolymer transport system component/DNA-binding winged helix-turn-helix (wHTH) protein